MTPHGLDVEALAVGFACVAAWALAAHRLARWNVSSALAMVVLGLIMANPPVEALDIVPTSEAMRVLTELALALVLFSDAAHVDLRALRSDAALPARLLLIGLPLTIAVGFVAATALTDLDPWLCALVATTLAPTDAALGAPVVLDPVVPMRIRRTLNVESGLNDGLATPLVTFFLAGAVSVTGAASDRSPHGAVRELAVGVAVGIAVGFIGHVLNLARRRHWTTESSIAIAVPVLALCAYFAALSIDGNGFIAAFVGGLVFGRTYRLRVTDNDDGSLAFAEFGEHLGELLGLVVWLTVGALAVDLLRGTTWKTIVFALLALTVLRMLPVAIALIGTGLDAESVAFIGWFGPRGLASIVFGITALEALPKDEGRQVISMIMLTVIGSVALHGATARPWTRRYAPAGDGTDDAGPADVAVMD